MKKYWGHKWKVKLLFPIFLGQLVLLFQQFSTHMISKHYSFAGEYMSYASSVLL